MRPRELPSEGVCGSLKTSFTYCHGFPDEFPAWSLCTDDKKELKWKIDGCKEFEILTEDISRMWRETWITGWKVIARDGFKIIGYRPESKTIFLFIPDSVYSYQVTEKELNFAGGSQYFRRFHTSRKIVSYLHCLAPIQTGMAAAQEEKDCDICRKMEQGGTSLDDLKELVAFYENLANKVIARC